MADIRLEEIPGFVAEGDVLGVNWAIAEGRQPYLVNPLQWPVPPALPRGPGPERVGITDELVPVREGVALLRPPSLVVGINPAPGALPEHIHALLVDTLAAAGLSRSAVAAIVTLDAYANTPSLLALGHPVHGFPADQLDKVDVPNPSEELRGSLGTASVCEAAALYAGGPTSRLILAKRWNSEATIAIVRRFRGIDLSGGQDVRRSVSTRPNPTGF